MNYLLVLLIVSLAVSAIGWKYFIYFFSLGYGLAITALAIATALLMRDVLTLPTLLLCIGLALFGIRLSGYLLMREIKSSSYRKILYSPEIQQKKPLGVILVVWFFCALLYVGQVSPVAFRLANTQAGMPVKPGFAWAGVVVLFLGILIETVADAQKNAAKKVNPRRFVDTGLYRIIRCPNYFGELVIWTGCLLSAFGCACRPWQWLIVLLGYVGIVYVMFSGARRLEIRQDSAYGTDPAYQAYVRKTPILLPFVPLYSVRRHKWLMA